MGTARFEVVAGKAVGTSILVEDELIIGRHVPEPGRLADDEEISRSHARISLDPSGFCAIEDLGSMNGTFVNGLRISSTQILAQGDTVELGSTTLVVREVRSPAPATSETPAAGAPTPGVQPTVVPPARPASGPPSEPGIEPPPPRPGVEPAEQPLPTASLQREPQARAPTEEPPGARAVPALGLRLEVDFEAREARIELDHSAKPIRLVWDAGAWRTLPASDGES